MHHDARAFLSQKAESGGRSASIGSPKPNMPSNFRLYCTGSRTKNRIGHPHVEPYECLSWNSPGSNEEARMLEIQRLE